MTQAKIGWRSFVSSTTSSTDTDAQAFITAAGITDSVQQSAITTLVADLKSYGLWTKMKAIYPFVGGSAASHKWNLKDPRDLDAAFRLVFNGGWVHSSNGAKPNGTNGYANTYLVPNSVFNVTDLAAAGYYSRTATVNVTRDYVLGAYTVGKGSFSMVIKRSNDNFYTQANADFPSGTTYRQLELSPNPYTADGLYHFSQQGTTFKYWRNTTLIGQNGVVSSNLQQSTHPIFLGTYNNNGTPATDWTDKEAAFSYFSTKLTDTEATNLYITIQKFQTTLGRHVGTPYVSDPDAIAFLMAAGITDGTQAAAINTLVIRMKADGVWTKMKAIYPFVGGTAFSHKFNLKDPRDLDAAYRLVFNGGWTHTATGALPNGTTGWADTKLSPSTTLTQWNTHLSYYSRTSTRQSSSIDIGSADGAAVNLFCLTLPRTTGGGGSCQYSQTNASDMASFSGLTDASGFWLSNRTSNIGTTHKASRNGIILATASTSAGNLVSQTIKIACLEANYLSNKETCFNSIGDGLTDAESTAFYNAIQEFQTTLGRQVNVPKVSDTDAQAFLNAANITSFQQASAVNKLVVDLKAAGIWTKMKAIYPFVGGSASSHKWNLKDPRDTDAAFRLVFNGGWTHSATGALPNGTNGWAETNFRLSNFASLSKASMGYYSRTNRAGAVKYNMGSWTDGASTTALASYWTDGKAYFYLNDNTGASINTTDSLGFYQMARNNSTTQLIASKNTTTVTANATIGNAHAVTLKIGAATNPYGLWGPDNLEASFAYFGDELSSTDLSNYYTAVETFQTALGRGVNTPIYNNGLVLNLDAGNANSYPGTGTTWFDLASGNNGTLVNGPTYDVNNGGSLYFDGTNDYGNFGNIQSLNSLTSGVTVGAWVKTSSTPSYSAILQKWYQSGVQGGFQMFVNPSGQLSIAIGDFISAYSALSSTTSILTGNWTYCVATYDLNSIKIYINGVLNASVSFVRSIINSNNATLYVGQDDYGSRFFRGNISSATVYNRALSATEILNNFNSTRGRFGL